MKFRNILCLLLTLMLCLSIAACRQRGAEGEESTSSPTTEEPQAVYSPEEARILEMLGGVVSYAELMEYYDFELLDVDTDLQKDPIVYYGQRDGVSYTRRKSGEEEYVLERDGVQFDYTLKDGAATLEDYLFVSDREAASLTTSGLEITVTGMGLYLNHAALPTLMPEDIVTETGENGGKTLRVGTEYFARFARALYEAQGMTASETSDMLETFSMSLVYDVDRNRMQLDGAWSAKYISYEEIESAVLIDGQTDVDTTLSGCVWLTEDGEALDRVELNLVQTDGESTVTSTLEIYDMVLENGAMVSCKTDMESRFTCTVTAGSYWDRVTYDVTATVTTNTVLTPQEDTVMTQVTKQETRQVAVGKNYSIHSSEELSTTVTRLGADSYDFHMSYQKDGGQKTGYLKATLRTPAASFPSSVPAVIEQAVAEACADGGEVARRRWEREAFDTLIAYLNETYPAAPIWFSFSAAVDAQEGGEVFHVTLDSSRTTPGDYRVVMTATSEAQPAEYYEINGIPHYRLQNGELTVVWEPDYLAYLGRLSRAFLESDYDVAKDRCYYVMDEEAGYCTLFNWYTDHFGEMECIPLDQFSHENLLASNATLPAEFQYQKLEYVNGSFR